MNTKLFKFILPGLLTGVLVAGCGKDYKYVKTEGLIWNTLYHITYKGPESLGDSILPMLDEVGASLSVFDRNSLVSRLNKTDSAIVDSHFIIVYDTSKKINGLSHGNFDPTVSPLVDAWGFGLGHTPTADTLMVDSILNFVGINKTERKNNLIIKDDPRIQFNFSAIAKGYGCDAVGEMFERNGVSDFMIEIGGEILLKGKSPSGKDWKIAVDAPVEGNNPGEEASVILSLTDVGIATSGNYRNFREEDGGKTAHTISPVTGRPYLSPVLSATIISSTCMEADAIATACMAGSPQEAKDLIEATGSKGILIFADSTWISPGCPVIE